MQVKHRSAIVEAASSHPEGLEQGGSQPVGHDPLGCPASLSQGSPKIIEKHGCLHYFRAIAKLQL